MTKPRYGSKKVPERVHWHYCAKSTPELTELIVPWCKVGGWGQLWVCREWEFVNCRRCLLMKQRNDEAERRSKERGMRDGIRN